jgi:cell division protease FtsH
MATATMEYGEFMARVEADKINQVSFSSDRAYAVVTQDSQRIKVKLPDDRDLIDRLTKNDVAITVLPPAEPFFWPIAQSLGFPILWRTLPLGLLLVILLVARNFMRRSAR